MSTKLRITLEVMHVKIGLQLNEGESDTEADGVDEYFPNRKIESFSNNRMAILEFTY